MTVMELTCMDCGRELRPDASDTYTEIKGFHRPRHRGGQNHVILREKTGRLLCPLCVVQRQMKLKPKMPEVLWED